MAEGIAWVEPPGLAGAIGMLPLPGLVIAKRGERYVDGALQEEVLDTLAARQTALLAILLDDDECDPDEIEDLGRAAKERSIALLRAPIADFSAPDQRLDWPALVERLAGELRQGRRIAFCCLAGYGRSGMMAARLLIATGSTPEAAIAAVRAARPGAIESEEQVAYLLSCAP
uniref:Tyrosine specific protein phosphatases domain-containing protein n=1 Tax=Bosea sp. NBC_00436 TaxID=2969620 RepID=A0A9E7ZSR2_9HYPH